MAVIPIDIAFYMVLVIFGILGNSLVLLTVISNAVENKTMPASDMILMNLTVTHLLLSVLRNVLVVTFQMGIDLLFSTSWCRVFMFLWTLLRSMSVWGTFSMSVFHYISIRNHYFKLRANSFITTIKVLAALWIFNSLYYIPALLYTSRGESNTTFSVQLISTSTRPVLGCVWNFPSPNANLFFVTASLVIHEIIPVILMVATNLGTLYTLQQHSRAIAAQKTINRVASEKKAAMVITTLVFLFVICWGTNVVAVNFYNFTKGASASTFLLPMANFAAYVFMGFSPLVLLIGHGKLRRKLISLICKQFKHQVNPVASSLKFITNVTTDKS
ncbi:olfactory receptor class A-like protein 4 [Rana temporaria]|uniref:olfactory receptor class A-like protein 4 n=1 Tax=Rana temporaria TaxID=8407 RepID=UPI001AAC7139|nr:olfactory receptor class A-like protein 4 [Rana temporaria]